MPVPDILGFLFGRDKPAPAAPASTGAAARLHLPDNRNEPLQICSPKVLLLVFDPIMDVAAGRRLSSEMGWSRPDGLVGRFIADVLQASGGLVRYVITERIELNEFPRLADGFQYDSATYRRVLKGETPPHSPPGVDYLALLERFDVPKRIEGGHVDEVWLMGFPHAGMYESIMAGDGAFWCNAPALTSSFRCTRRFVIMGFSFERDVGEMLHAYNHRAEAIMARVFNSLDFLAWAYKLGRTPVTIAVDQKLNHFQRFILFDQIAPGNAGVGTVHYPPNGIRDYDLGNPRPVASSCYDWLNFPEFKGDVRTISASEWGGGSERAYQRWWMRHLPKVAGRTNGIHNNWWQYIANLDNVTD